ncbi:hypothetical protein JB92DRAFT_3095707 [Gautieria morchelliformis]|nr:hypothetical protein JB92DRAFT_3095707 [Gautieria morchelliformis]
MGSRWSGGERRNFSWTVTTREPMETMTMTPVNTPSDWACGAWDGNGGGRGPGRSGADGWRTHVYAEHDAEDEAQQEGAPQVLVPSGRIRHKNKRCEEGPGRRTYAPARAWSIRTGDREPAWETTEAGAGRLAMVATTAERVGASVVRVRVRDVSRLEAHVADGAVRALPRGAAAPDVPRERGHHAAARRRELLRRGALPLAKLRRRRGRPAGEREDGLLVLVLVVNAMK